MNEMMILGSLVFIAYTYFGYPLILWAWTRFFPDQTFPSDSIFNITVFITAFNEEDCIGQTIESILKSDYPPQSLRVLVASDGSTDRTNGIVLSFDSKQVQLIRGPGHFGKQNLLKTYLPNVKDDLILITDASSIFRPDTIKTLVRHFSDERVGSATGSKNILSSGTALAQSDGLYWRYERWLRQNESLTGSSWSGVEGGLFAIRKKAFSLDFPQECSSDYSICACVLKSGYLNRYDPAAIIDEPASKDFRTEFHRKIRVIVRHIKAFLHFSSMLNPIRYPGFFFQNISHRLFRWLVPFFLILMAVSSGLSRNPVMRGFFWVQIIFYGLGLIGILQKWQKRSPSSKLVSIPAYFLLMNIAALLSWGMLFRKYQSWHPPQRESLLHENS